MDSLYLLIPVALVFVAVGIKLLLWAIDDGQYDDLDKEAWRILAEEEPTSQTTTENNGHAENDEEKQPSQST